MPPPGWRPDTETSRYPDPPVDDDQWEAVTAGSNESPELPIQWDASLQAGHELWPAGPGEPGPSRCGPDTASLLWLTPLSAGEPLPLLVDRRLLLLHLLMSALSGRTSGPRRHVVVHLRPGSPHCSLVPEPVCSSELKPRPRRHEDRNREHARVPRPLQEVAHQAWRAPPSRPATTTPRPCCMHNHKLLLCYSQSHQAGGVCC